MKKLLLLSLAVLLFSCGDNDDSNSDSTQNFLEKYNGVVWKDEGFDDGSGTDTYIYVKFTPNSVTECEKYTDCDCTTVDWGAVEPDGAYIRVVENLPEKLVLEQSVLNDDDILELETITLTTINNGNGLEFKFSFDPNYLETWTRVSDFCE
jgi:hypothetical protein